jgi:hypothetical protein
MKNCWGLQDIDSKLLFNSGSNLTKERTSSFNLYLVRMPEAWDSGSGNDYTKDGFFVKNYSISENGSNWFNSATETPWSITSGVFTGITSGDTNIVGYQRLDIGNEDLNIDITTEVNNIISGITTNNGFMLCFDYNLEQTSKSNLQYVGFFTNNTTTFFKPYLETKYSEYIVDDRHEFYLDKNNKLYFYSLIGGEYTNLDNIPTCHVDGVEYQVKQATKGIYYVDVNLSIQEHQPVKMIYDVWSNINYNGTTFQNVELEFVTKHPSEYFNFGNQNYEPLRYVPNVYGVKYDEKINKGQKLNIFVNPRIEYTTNTSQHITGMEYRLYVKDANNEITVIDYEPINRMTNKNSFTIFTNDLLPNKYFIDIKINRYNEEIVYKEKLKFEIIN